MNKRRRGGSSSGAAAPAERSSSRPTRSNTRPSLSNAKIVFRVDPRLVHATTLNGWVPALSARLLVVADRDVVADRERRAIMELATTGEIDLIVSAEEDVAQVLRDYSERGPILCLFSSLESVRAAHAHGLALEDVVIGHLPSGPERAELHPAVWLGEKDFEVARALEAKGVRFWVRALPQDTPVPLGELRPIESTPPERTERLESLPVTTPPPRISSAPRSEEGETIEAQLTIVNPKGLHLRAAHALATLAAELPSDVKVLYDGEEANARSLLALTGLGAACGAELLVRVQGPDAAGCLAKVRGLIENGFGEKDDPAEGSNG